MTAYNSEKRSIEIDDVFAFEICEDCFAFFVFVYYHKTF